MTFAKYVDKRARIFPGVETFGLKENAFLRDLTVNSLFYNVKDSLIEDLTGKGLEDI